MSSIRLNENVYEAIYQSAKTKRQHLPWTTVTQHTTLFRGIPKERSGYLTNHNDARMIVPGSEIKSGNRWSGAQPFTGQTIPGAGAIYLCLTVGSLFSEHNKYSYMSYANTLETVLLCPPATLVQRNSFSDADMDSLKNRDRKATLNDIQFTLGKQFYEFQTARKLDAISFDLEATETSEREAVYKFFDKLSSDNLVQTALRSAGTHSTLESLWADPYDHTVSRALGNLALLESGGESIIAQSSPAWKSWGPQNRNLVLSGESGEIKSDLIPVNEIFLYTKDGEIKVDKRPIDDKLPLASMALIQIESE